jgi:subtilisin family serine protease
MLAAGVVALTRREQPSPAVSLPAAEEQSAEQRSADPLVLARRLECLIRLGVKAWHDAGWRGQGVKIAILDTGFRGYRAYLGRVLPANVTVRSFRSDGNLEARDSQHGILCAEVVHAIAPDAELLFANWDPDQPEQFLAAARWAREQGVRVISCSVIMPRASDGEGGGPANAELARILGPGHQPGDLLCFASAGNTAQRHWSGPFCDGGDGFHAWRAGQTANGVTPWGAERVAVELYWQPGPDYDLIVDDVTGQREVGRSAACTGVERTAAVVRFLPEAGHAYQVRVRLARGSGGRFHLTALAANLDHATAPGSVAFPADNPRVLAMGAVDADGRRMAYSACGPNSPRPKPDLVAPVPFVSLWRARPFAGTSAASPQASAMAALWWSRHPDRTAAQVRTALRRHAADLGPAGHDFETGYGRVTLPPPKSPMTQPTTR